MLCLWELLGASYDAGFLFLLYFDVMGLFQCSIALSYLTGTSLDPSPPLPWWDKVCLQVYNFSVDNVSFYVLASLRELFKKLRREKLRPKDKRGRGGRGQR